jgi:hypothetical protein
MYTFSPFHSTSVIYYTWRSLGLLLLLGWLPSRFEASESSNIADAALKVACQLRQESLGLSSLSLQDFADHVKLTLFPKEFYYSQHHPPEALLPGALSKLVNSLLQEYMHMQNLERMLFEATQGALVMIEDVHGLEKAEEERAMAISKTSKGTFSFKAITSKVASFLHVHHKKFKPWMLPSLTAIQYGRSFAAISSLWSSIAFTRLHCALNADSLGLLRTSQRIKELADTVGGYAQQLRTHKLEALTLSLLLDDGTTATTSHAALKLVPTTKKNATIRCHVALVHADTMSPYMGKTRPGPYHLVLYAEDSLHPESRLDLGFRNYLTRLEHLNRSGPIDPSLWGDVGGFLDFQQVDILQPHIHQENQ